MIVKKDLLDFSGIQLAISTELERDLRHALRFTRCINAESIGFAFRLARNGVQNRGQEKGE